MLSNRLLKDHVRTAENYPNFVREVSCSFLEHPGKGCNKVSFHSCALTCNRKICLCQAEPETP